MKLSGGLSEKGVLVGNIFDKYGSGNIIVRKIMQGFESTLYQLVLKTNPSSIHEVGCGEGYWTLKFKALGYEVRGSDFSNTVIALADKNANDHGYAPGLFAVRNIYRLEPVRDSAELVLCCEVLEHLEQPREALRALQKIVQKNVILSVPKEPLWSVLNMARGKYWSDLGNTPGHIQRWSRLDFISLVSQFFKVKEVRTPIPWTMLLCRAH